VRGCLGFIVIVLAIIAVIALLAVRFVVPEVTAAAVRDSPYFQGQPVTVAVDSSLPGIALRGRVDSISISGQNLHEGSLTIGRLDVTLFDVSLLDRSFDRLAGTLGSLALPGPNGASLALDAVQLSGSSGQITATADVAAALVAETLKSRLDASGLPVDTVTLGNGQITIGVAGQTIETRLALGGSSVVLEFVPPQIAGITLPQLTLVQGTAGQPWQLTAIDVTPAGVRITALVAGPTPG
jgi:hypothetical protein